MPLATFDFPYHEFEDTYPETGGGMKFGNAYEFRSGPTAPPEREFTLTMTGMRYITQSNGSMDTTSNAKLNAMVLDQFYRDHQLHNKFNYPHPTRGTLVCRFAQPLKIPKPIRGGSGVLPDFEIRLIEQP